MYTQDNDQYVCSYGHLVNCFGKVFVGLFLFLHLLLSSFMIWWLTIMLCLDSLSYLCTSITDFWFAVTGKFLLLIKGYAAAKSLQSCLTLCGLTRLPRLWNSPGKNTVVGCHFLLQCIKVKKVKLLSHVWLLVTPWIAAYQALSMGFSRQESWSGLPLPSPMKGYMYM